MKTNFVLLICKTSKVEKMTISLDAIAKEIKSREK